MSITARVVADSINPWNSRLTTMVVTFPRYILAEFNTHRAFSRNSASSRAIPFKKMLKAVQTDTFSPLAWMKDHSGMQGTEYFSITDVDNFNVPISERLDELWIGARDAAISFAERMHALGATKQMVNRILEPYMWHTCIVTSSEWENFFAQRAHNAADIHIEELANKMLVALNESTPRKIVPGDWHIPFQADIFRDPNFLTYMTNYFTKKGILLTHQSPSQTLRESQAIAVEVATAKCARASYITFDADKSIEEQVELHAKLKAGNPKHMSPFEHSALCGEERSSAIASNFGSYNGWIQYRKMIDGENATDPRVLRKY